MWKQGTTKPPEAPFLPLRLTVKGHNIPRDEKIDVLLISPSLHHERIACVALSEITRKGTLGIESAGPQAAVNGTTGRFHAHTRIHGYEIIRQ